MPAGTCVLLGSARSGTEVTLDMAVPAVRPGCARRHPGREPPKEFIPQLVDLLVQGKMPVDRMITSTLADINRAAHDSASRGHDKPVLRMAR